MAVAHITEKLFFNCFQIELRDFFLRTVKAKENKQTKQNAFLRVFYTTPAQHRKAQSTQERKAMEQAKTKNNTNKEK